MKKLLLSIYILLLGVPTLFSQEPYLLEKVIVSAWDYTSKKQIFKKNLNDSVQIATTPSDFPMIPVFKSVTLADGKIYSVELMQDDNMYELSPEDNTLRLSEPQHAEEQIPELPKEKNTKTANGFQLPPYTIEQSGNRLTIIFDRVIYGSSNYPTQTLEGKCDMIYVKP